MSDGSNWTAQAELERKRRVEELGQRIAWHLEQIRQLFKTDNVVHVSLTVRAPAHPDGKRDVVLTDDPEPQKAMASFMRGVSGVGAPGFEFQVVDRGRPPS